MNIKIKTIKSFIIIVLFAVSYGIWGAPAAPAAKAADAKKAEAAAKAAEAKKMAEMKKIMEARKAAEAKKTEALQHAKDKKSLENSLKEKKEGKSFFETDVVRTSSSTKKIQPQAGLHLSPIIPLGEVGSVMGVGVAGINIFGNVTIPSKYLKMAKMPLHKYGVEARGGLSFGYASMASSTSDFEGTLTLIPILLYLRFDYNKLKVLRKWGQLKPLFQLGYGGSMTSLDKTFSKEVTKGAKGGNASSNVSAFEAMLDIGIGSSFTLRKVKNVEFQALLRYMMLFEQSTGSFMSFSFGAAYNLKAF